MNYFLSLASLLMLLTAVCPLSGEESEQRNTRAFFNPKVSTRDLALNQSVSVTFTTLRPQVEEVDPESQVIGALAQPGVTDTWRVHGQPQVNVDPKIGTLRVHMVLIPRTTGTLDLPEIPVRWLSGTQVARFGKVTVGDHLAHGARTLPIPDDHQQVSGYAWGTSYEELLEAMGQEKGQVDEHGELRLSANDGLDLIIRGGRLAAAQITAPGLPFAQARPTFHQRWGDSLGGSSGEAAVWLIGWIRIEAKALGEGTVIKLVHEGIESQIAQGAVESQVFSLLDGDGATPPAQSEREPDAEDAADSAAPETSGQSDFDPQAEFERALRESPDPGPR